VEEEKKEEGKIDMNKLFNASFRQPKVGGKKYVLTADKPIYDTIANRLAYYIRDTDYEFVESARFFRIATRFHKDYYDEININERGFNTRQNLLIYLISMNLRVM
jgi:hypothetical protein